MSETGEFSTVLACRFSSSGQLSPNVLSELLRHYELLLRWNRTLNLTSITVLEQAVERHYCESLFLGVHLPESAVSVLDIGSGAGFPGVPMAILRPDCKFTLAESHQRKAVFLREATRHLSNVRVVACRAEDAEGAFDWVVSRAVRWPDVLRAARRCGARAQAAASRPSPAVGLLLGQDDAADVRCESGFEWQPLVALPWGLRRVLLVGHALP
jgi:16S rRNA (guanine527-N7)-methyltransferase